VWPAGCTVADAGKRVVADRFRIGGFEKKLLIVFLVLSVAPTLLIAVFGVRYFSGYVDRLSNVALRESFRNSMEIARQYSSRLDRDAATMARRMEAAYPRELLSAGRRTDRFLQTAAEKNDADFVALYVLEDSAWKMASCYPRNLARLDTLLTADMISTDTGPQKIVFSDQDVVASGIRLDGEAVLIGGFLLEPGMLEMMRKTGDDLSRYSSVGLYVRMLRRYSLIVIGALVVVMAISSALASRLLAKRISYPIRELAVATDRIARGDLQHRVKVKAKDELQSLVSSFNNMTQELEENKKNLIAMARREAQVARDFEIARQVQQNLFPEALPSEAGWDFAATCRPARAVGGDYYDIFEVSPGKVLFAQGDVAGKGLGASLVMASVHAIVRSWAGAVHEDPSKLIGELNNYLIASSSPETFVTMFLGVLDCSQGNLWYVNCGHPPALLVHSTNGKVDGLTDGGPLLGIIAGDNYEAGECKLAGGDTIVLVSDGVTEATNPEGHMFEHARLIETITRNSKLSASRAMQAVMGEVDTFAEGAEQADDISIMVLRRTT
jgi:serine phosphatase RsbU (regulator of sigma subunit)